MGLTGRFPGGRAADLRLNQGSSDWRVEHWNWLDFWRFIRFLLPVNHTTNQSPGGQPPVAGGGTSMTNYVLATIEGLHLTCDFVIYRAALYGCPPDYTPTPVGLHHAFREPYEVHGSIPFNQYDRFALVSAMDEPTLEAVADLNGGKLRDSTCVAFELEAGTVNLGPTVGPAADDALLQKLLERGERILDTMRLFLFKPGEKQSIGRVGAIGKGVGGAWIGNESQAKFIARKLFDYQFAQDPMDVSLDDVRDIYNDPVFREIHSAGCSDPDRDDPLLRRVFQSLRSFRKSREMPTPENRFLELVRMAEHLAKKDDAQKLQGAVLRERIAKIAHQGWEPQRDFLGTTTDLWTNVRNEFTHRTATFSEIGRDPATEIPRIEEVVIGMVRAVVIAWRNEQFGVDPYAALFGA